MPSQCKMTILLKVVFGLQMFSQCKLRSKFLSIVDLYLYVLSANEQVNLKLKLVLMCKVTSKL